jgi:hypothetical protein
MNLFTLDQPEGAYDDRAYTRIDMNRVVVGNRWIERTWSGFFGHTSSVIQKSGELEWVAAQNPEFSFTVNGKVLGPKDLDEIDVSDEFCEMGGTVCIRKSGPGLDILYKTTALHDSPILLRSISLTNTGSAPLEISNIQTETLIWEPEECAFWADQFNRELDVDWSSSEENPALSIQTENQGLILGAIGTPVVQLNRSENPGCQIAETESIELPPRATWQGAKSYIIAFTRDPFDAHAKHFTAQINELRLQEKREEDIQRLLAEEN